MTRKGNRKFTQRRGILRSSGKGYSVRKQPSSSSEETEGSEDETYSPSTSSGNRSHASSAETQQNIPAAKEAALVSDCVLHLLVADQKKHAIKKIDILKHVFKDNKKCFKQIMKKADEHLRNFAGISVHELADHKGQYILVNELNNSSAIAEISNMAKMKLGLTMVVLSIIFMNEDLISEAEMWKALCKIGVDPDSKHPVFGDVKRFVCVDLLKQMYVEYKKEGIDPPVYKFSWGARAKLEISKLEVLKFVCSIYGDSVTPQSWASQYKDAVLESEGQGAGQDNSMEM